MRPNNTNEPKATSRLKIFLIAVGVMIVSAAVYLETIKIPGLLAGEVGSLAIYLHFGAILVLIGTTSYLTKATIYGTFDRLMAAHLNNTVSTIGNLANGYWSSDARIQQGVFTTAAKMGFALRDEVIEPDRAAIVNGISAMQLPQTRQAPGVGMDVIEEMDAYQDDLSARKERLS